jgi:hypothetical protein
MEEKKIPPHPASVELKKLYEADQEKRRNTAQFFKELANNREGDQITRLRVAEIILNNNDVLTAEDFFYAAMIFQHGFSTDDYWKAHEFAKRSSELGENRANWLVLATHDRWLMSQGKPQKYCTQYVRNEKTGEYELYPYDEAITDDERLQAGAKTVSEALEFAKKISTQFN